MDVSVGKFGIGQPVRRVEDQRFITGRGRYVDDITLPQQAYGVLVMSPHGHARIKRIDTTKAKAAEGVLAVLTAQDVATDKLGLLIPAMPEDFGAPKGYRASRPLLAADKVRCVGDRVAFVVADTEDQARAAAELIEIDYEPLPAVTTIEEATAPGAPTVWDDNPGNIAFILAMGNKEAADAAFANAKHVVSLKLTNNRLSANSMETRAAIGDYAADSDSYTLYTSSQNPHGFRSQIAGQVLHIPETKLRVISPDVGGGFGMKGSPYPEDALVLWASRRVNRPVKWTSTRAEALAGDAHGRDQVVTGEIALDESGKILGIRAQSMHAVGSHVTAAAFATSMFSVKLLSGVYDIPAGFIFAKAVLTNTSPMAPYRGAGRPEATYLVERLIERAAAVLKMDPVALRMKNYIPASKMPYTNTSGIVYDSGDFARVTEECLRLADRKGFEKRRAESKKNGKLRGWGMAYFLEEAAIFNDRMDLRFDPSGQVTILAGTHSHGQGHATVYAQMVSEWLGVPFENIKFIQGDTNEVPIGRGTYGSRSMMVGGNALKRAADQIIEKAKPMAAKMLEAAASDLEFKNGRFTVVGTDKSIELTNVAKAFYAPMFLPNDVGVGLEAAGTFAAEPPCYPNGCHTCEVEVDPQTGVVQVVRYTACDDVGKVMNHMLAEGQVHGGVAQGLGQALMEHVVYDSSGQLLSGTFMDYAMPRADDMPNLEGDLVEVPAATNPLGVKGCGEAGATGAPPAIMAALLDALKPLGIEDFDMPATPERVWQAIHRASAKAA
ncbi:MAG TPA: xanthine dehydrogenase family protein molybdopterin-binding subunit [Xanthobacteraceae bacterium]|nr:xanthine dehydrogenase family protein molybdopterin-binding subunit [Xanthobacteraceae bacterium]